MKDDPKPSLTHRIILDLCAGSGNWSKPYAESGYDVYRVDLPHDVRLWKDYTGMNVHGVLAAPPCTVFAGSGARWPRTDEEMVEGISVVDACLRIIMMTRPKWWVLENPIGKLVRWLGKPRMYFQPYEYGDPYTKRTALWGEFNVPEKSPVEPVEGGKIHRMAPSPDRSAKRGLTPMGFARAFCEANP